MCLEKNLYVQMVFNSAFHVIALFGGALTVRSSVITKQEIKRV